MLRALKHALVTLVAISASASARLQAADEFQISEDGDRIRIQSSALEAAVRKHGYVSGIEGRSLLDRKTGFRDAGFGLDIVDWIMEPGSDEAYRDQLPKEMVYVFGNAYHGKTPKRSRSSAAKLSISSSVSRSASRR